MKQNHNYQNELHIMRSKLQGNVTIDGAKNSALRLMVASILTEDEIVLNRFPSGLMMPISN